MNKMRKIGALVSICGMGAFSLPAFADDTVIMCTPNGGGQTFIVTHFDGQNLGWMTSRTFDGEVIVFPGIGMMSFINMNGSENAADVENFNVAIRDGSYQMTHGSNLTDGTCQVINYGSTYDALDSNGGSQSRT